MCVTELNQLSKDSVLILQISNYDNDMLKNLKELENYFKLNNFKVR